MRVKLSGSLTQDRDILTLIPGSGVTLSKAEIDDVVDDIQVTVGSPDARTQAALTGRGLITETFELANHNGLSAPVTGDICCVAVGLRAGDVVSNLTVHASAGGTSLTIVKMALLSKTGTRLATTADVKADFGTAGLKTEPMITPYTVPVDDLYYCAWLDTHGGTSPTLSRGQGTGTGFAAIGTGARLLAVQTGQTDIGTTVTLANAAGSTINVWFGVS